MLNTNIVWKRISWIVLILLFIGLQTKTNSQETACHVPGVLFEPLRNENATLSVINTNNTGAQWFLLRSGENQHLGPISPGFKFIHAIRASEDGRYLAVILIGEGHSLLEIIDLPQLLQKKSYRVFQTIDPYPGNIEIDSWNGGQLRVKSDVLLTHRDKSTGRIPPDMVLSWQETFILDILTGQISGASDGGGEPAEHYARMLLDQHTTEAEKDRALAKLLSVHSGEISLPFLLKVLEREQDPRRMNLLLDEISKLRE